jgi:putative ATPase
MDAVNKEHAGEVPIHLQNQGKNLYKYAHDFPKHYVEQAYLPMEHRGKNFYQPSDMGYEEKLAQYMKWMKGNK